MAAKWNLVGDRCSKEFIEFHKPPSRKASISELVVDGRSLRSPSDIEQHIQQFYSELYTNDPAVDANETDRAQCLRSVPQRITEEMNMELTKDFTNAEVKKALMDIPANRAPGHDSIPPELFKEMWEVVGDDLTEFITESLKSGRLEPDILYGIFALIPKGGTLTSIRNYRPISIFTGMYKLIAKSLAKRIQPILPECILPTQTAFVKDRCILDNVFLAQEAIEWAKESSQDLVVLLLDFEKAYDRVNWSFLEATMSKLGFSNLWVSWFV